MLYHKLYTHWSYAGAYIGAVSLINELGVEIPSLEEVHKEPVYSSTGDLANMLNITVKNGDIDYSIDTSQIGVPECEKSDFNAEYSFHMSGADDRRLFVRRDSFSTAMMPFIASQFENSLFMHCNSFQKQQIFDYDADIFVLETAERYIPSLEGFSISFIDYSIEEEGENKIISIAPAIICDDSQYVSIFKKNKETDEIMQYQVVEPLENEMKIQVPDDENGEIYVYVFKDKNGDEMVEEVVIQY